MQFAPVREAFLTEVDRWAEGYVACVEPGVPVSVDLMYQHVVDSVGDIAWRWFGEHARVPKKEWMSPDAWAAIVERQRINAWWRMHARDVRCISVMDVAFVQWARYVAGVRAHRAACRLIARDKSRYETQMLGDMQWAFEHQNTAKAWQLVRELAGLYNVRGKTVVVPPADSIPSDAWDGFMHDVFQACPVESGYVHPPVDVCPATVLAICDDWQWWVAALARSRSGKAVPRWAVPAEILKLLAQGGDVEWLARHQILALLLGRCLEAQQMPTLWSHSAVTPMPKDGGIGPYFRRLLNILDPCGQWFCRVLMDTYHPPVYCGQSGFVRGRSLLDNLALVGLVRDKAHDAGFSLALQFWDLDKAFDRLDRESALQLVDCHAPPHVGRLLRDYYQHAVLEIDGRSWWPGTGVLQGSVQGPMLFRPAMDEALQEFQLCRGDSGGCASLDALYVADSGCATRVPCDLGAFADDVHHMVVARRPLEVFPAMRAAVLRM